MTEVSVIDEAVSEEDKVVHIIGSLPDAYDVLVTAFKSGSGNSPALATVTERLLREELSSREKRLRRRL